MSLRSQIAADAANVLQTTGRDFAEEVTLARGAMFLDLNQWTMVEATPNTNPVILNATHLQYNADGGVALPYCYFHLPAADVGDVDFSLTHYIRVTYTWDNPTGITHTYCRMHLGGTVHPVDTPIAFSGQPVASGTQTSSAEWTGTGAANQFFSFIQQPSPTPVGAHSAIMEIELRRQFDLAVGAIVREESAEGGDLVPAELLVNSADLPVYPYAAGRYSDALKGGSVEVRGVEHRIASVVPIPGPAGLVKLGLQDATL